MKEKIKEILKIKLQGLQCSSCSHRKAEDKEYYCEECCGIDFTYWEPSGEILDEIANEILECKDKVETLQ